MPQQSRNKSAFQRVTSAVKKLFMRGRADLDETREAASIPAAEPRQRPHRKSAPYPARAARREADIPLDVLSRAYTPPATSSKAGFRSSGADHQRDQEFATGTADTTWKDEDHLTNRSGDPRIGTHGRTYEAREARREE